MSRRERACRKMPSWMLRRLLAQPFAKAWWTAAYLELWEREVEAEVAAASSNDSGPWPCAMPRGIM